MNWSAPYAADPSMVRQLKAVDASAELVYLAQGTWALVAKPEGVDLTRRKLTGRNMLREMFKKGAPDPVSFRSAQLIADGYGIVVQQRFDHAPLWSLVRWFEEADHVAKTDFDAAYDKRDAASDGRQFEQTVVDTMEDWRATEGVRGYRHVFQGLRHFT